MKIASYTVQEFLYVDLDFDRSMLPPKLQKVVEQGKCKVLGASYVPKLTSDEWNALKKNGFVSVGRSENESEGQL